MSLAQEDQFQNCLDNSEETNENSLAFDTCCNLNDFKEINYDVDSLHIIGNKSLSWLKPMIHFVCPLNSVHAWPCRDKKLTNRLIKKINYEDSLKAGFDAEPLQPELRYTSRNTSWITFSIGNSGLEKVRVYALISNDQKVKENKVMKYYRKNFFDAYILKALNNLLPNVDKTNSNFSHTSMINAMHEIPSDCKIRIYPDSWVDFTKGIDNLLKEGLPEFTIGIFFGLTVHGVKSDWNLMAGRITERFESFVNFDDLSKFALIQVHIAMTLKCPNQLVVADKTKLNKISRSRDTDIYQKFCLKKDLVFFTIKKFRNPSFSNISHTQFYPENWHILLNENYNLRACFFVNAALGLNGVGSLKEDVIKECKNLPDLNKHIDNIINWCNKLKSCMSSIEAGTVGRIESVFSIVDFNDETNEAAQKLLLNNKGLLDRHFNESLEHFKNVVEYVIENKVIIKSKGTWWKKYVNIINKYVVEPLINQAMFNQHVVFDRWTTIEKPLLVSELKRIYDMEQVLLMWIDQRGNKSSIRYDALRTRKLIQILQNKNSENLNSKTGTESTEDNLLADVTDLMSIRKTENDESDNTNSPRTGCQVIGESKEFLKEPDFILAIADLESNEKSKKKWFDSRSVTCRGYFPSIAKYCEFMIGCAPEDTAQKRQLIDHPVLDFMSCYEICVAKNWEMKTMANESVFSLEAFERIKKARRSKQVLRLTLDNLTITSYAVVKAIKKPITVLGKTIINRTFSMEEYQNLLNSDNLELLEFVQENIKVFPKFLIDANANSYYKWHLVEDAPIVRGSELETNNGNPKLDYFRQDKIDRYYKKLDYRRHLKNFKRFKR